jgi:hypothetical protein
VVSNPDPYPDPPLARVSGMPQSEIEETGKKQVRKELPAPKITSHAGDPVVDLALPMLHW